MSPLARFHLTLALVLACAAALVLSSSASSDPSEGIRVLITFKSAPTSGELDAVSRAGGSVLQRYQIIPAVAAVVPGPAIAELAASEHIVRIEVDGTARALDYRSSHDWGIARVHADAVHRAGNTGVGARVAIVDSGISCAHVELYANCVSGPTYVPGTTSSDDDYGHGTHVAGTVAGELNANSSTGVVGVAPGAVVVAYKVLDSGGSGPWSNVIAAIDHVWNSGAPLAEVVNMSLGGNSAPAALESALNRAYAAGIVLVAAAGNGGNCKGKGDSLSYPARYASVIAVAATNQSDVRACFSSTGRDLELAAPGVSVFSTWPEDLTSSPHDPQPVCEAGVCHYKFGSGTSMASPHVAGVAALLLASGLVTDSNRAYGRADEVRARLNATARDLGIAGRDSQYGYGLVDSFAAVSAP